MQGSARPWPRGGGRQRPSPTASCPTLLSPTARPQIHPETSVLPFPLHMHQVGDLLPSRAPEPRRINTSAGASSPLTEGLWGSVCVRRGKRTEPASDDSRTSSRTINTIQLMSTGVSGASPCEPVTCLLHSPVPASRPAGAKGSARAQGPSPAPHGSLTVLTCGAAGRGRARSPAGWPRWPWRTDLRGEGGSAARPGAGFTPPSTPQGPQGSHLLHRAGCTAPAAASTQGGGGGGAWRAGAEMVRSGAALRSSPHRRLLQCCCSSRCPLPPRSRCGPSPELSSRLSVEEKAAGAEGRGYAGLPSTRAALMAQHPHLPRLQGALSTEQSEGKHGESHQQVSAQQLLPAPEQGLPQSPPVPHSERSCLVALHCCGT